MSERKEWDKPIIHLSPNFVINYFKENEVDILDKDTFVSELLYKVSCTMWKIANDIVREQYNDFKNKIYENTRKIMNKVLGENEKGK